MSWQEEKDKLKGLLNPSYYAGPDSTWEQEAQKLRALRGPAGLPSTPQWLAGFPDSAAADEPAPEKPFWEPLEAAGPNNELQTSLDLTRGQRQAQRAARTATRNNERVIREAGLQKDYKFEQQAQEGGGWTKPLFDMINIFPQVETGFVSELVRTGSAWEAFKQATAEAADALPWLEKDSSAWLTGKEARMSGKGFGNLLNETGYLPPGLKASAVGLVLDILLDPTAWTGKGLVGRGLTRMGAGDVAKGIGAVGKAANYLPGTMGSVTKAMGGVSQKILRTQAAQEFIAKSPVIGAVRAMGEKFFDADRGLGKTAPGRALLALAPQHRAIELQEASRQEEMAKRFMAATLPMERRIILGVMHQEMPYIHAELENLARAGVIPNERVPMLKEQAEAFRKTLKEMEEVITKESPQGLQMLDEAQLISSRKLPDGTEVPNFYVPGMDPMSPESLRLSREQIENLGGTPRELMRDTGGTGSAKPVSAIEDWAKEKQFSNLYQRLIAGLPVELDGGHVLAAHGFSYARAVATQWLLDNVLSHPDIGAYRMTMEAANQEMVLAGATAEQLGRKNYERFLLEHPDGPKGIVDLYKGRQHSAMVVVPKEVADGLNKAGQFFANPTEIGAALKAFDKYQSIWKAYAVLTPGFHARNWFSNHFNMWRAGMHPVLDMPKYQGMGLTVISGDADNVLQKATSGRRTAVDLKKPVDKLLFNGKEMKATIRWNDAWVRDGLTAPIRDQGQALKHGEFLNVGEVRDLAEKRGMVGNGQMVSEIQREASRQSYRDLEQLKGDGNKAFYEGMLPRVQQALANGVTLDPMTIATIKTEANTATLRSWWQRTGVAQTVLDNPVTRLNRSAGSLLEDTDKMALFIHSMAEEGARLSPFDAGLKVKKHMFEYGALTDTEKQVMKRAIPFYAWCVPDDVEMLTREGWKKVDQLRVGEDVLSLNHDIGESSWGPLKAVNTFDYNGCMLRLQTGRDDFLFTPDHRWPIYDQHGEDPRIVKGYELRSNHRIPRASKAHQFPAVSIVTPRIAAIIGWLVTDGYMRTRTRSPNHVEMLIYQSPSKCLEKIKALLGEHGSAGKPHPDTGVVAVRIVGKLREEISQIIRSKDDFIHFVCGLDKEAAEACYQAMMDAEGSTAYAGTERAFSHFSQLPGPVLDGFQILVQLLGKVANISAKGAYVGKGSHLGVRFHLTDAHYTGRVWCPETENGTWLMRRNGRVIWTGNSRFNIPLQLESIFHDPGSYSIVPKLQNEIEAMSPEWQDLPTPDYFDELNAVRLPYMRGGKPLYLQPGLPYADLNRIPRPLHPSEDLKKEAISAMGPIPKLALSLLANKDFFYNKPIETYPGDMSQEIPGVGKTQQWAIESQFPALQRIMSAYRAAKKSELQPWLLSNVAGVKILPNDIARTTKGHVYGKLAISKVLADKARMLGKVREKEEEGD